MPVSLRKHDDRQGERGAAFLIVVMALLALASVLMLLGVSSFRLDDTQDRIRQTAQRQDFIIDQLAAFVQREHALPCPADPDIAPGTAAFGVARVDCDTTTAKGIIPFRTLNLSTRDAQDGWGRFMTYHISPVLAPNNVTTGSQIFMRCRRQDWFDGSPANSAFNTHPAKARFCCPPVDTAAVIAPATDLQVLSVTGASVEPSFGRGSTAVTTAAGVYAPVDTPVSLPGVTQGARAPIPTGLGFENEETFAVGIISHGRNGFGAFVANGTTDKLEGPLGTDEDENQDNDNIIVDRTVSNVEGAAYFDDIVIWRTQITLMGELNNASCYRPWGGSPADGD